MAANLWGYIYGWKRPVGRDGPTIEVPVKRNGCGTPIGWHLPDYICTSDGKFLGMTGGRVEQPSGARYCIKKNTIKSRDTTYPCSTGIVRPDAGGSSRLSRKRTGKRG